MQQRRRRSGLILGLMALGLLAGAALTAHPAQAFVSGPGPYYAEPAWDQIKGAGRFLVLTNWASQAVLDKETGLVWERSPDAITLNWPDARIFCIDKPVGDRKGWRLPSISELASLIVPSVTPGPTLSPGHPFLTVQSGGYWSATTSVTNSLAWRVDFGNGSVDTSNSSALHIWCVRGGMNEGTY